MYSRDSSYYIYDEGGNIIEKQYFVWRDNNFYKLSFSKYTYDSFGKRMKGQLYRGNEYADSTLFIYSENIVVLVSILVLIVSIKSKNL